MGIRILISFLLIFCTTKEVSALYGRFESARAYSDKKNYKVEANEEYRFKGCEEYSTDKEDYYLFSCNEDIFEGPVNSLEKSQYRITKKLYEDNFLSDLKEYTLSSLKKNEDSLIETVKCLDSDSDECKKKNEFILKYLRENIPKYRKVIALSEIKHIGGRGFSSYHIDKDIEHDSLDYDLPPLSKNEFEELNEIKSDILYNINQDNLSNLNNSCVSYDYEYKAQRCPRRISLKIRREKSKSVSRVKEQYKKEYNRMSNSDPLLARLSLRGDEDDSEIINELKKQLKESIKANKKSYQKISKLNDDDDLIDLIKNKSAVDGYISQVGNSKAVCDISQGLYEEVETGKLLTSLYIGGAAIVGGGLCLGTFGLGCALSVGIAAEAVDLYMQQNELNQSRESFSAGIGSLDAIDSARSDRDMAIAFVAVGSTGHLLKPIAKVSKVGFRSSKSGVSKAYEDVKSTRELSTIRNYNPRHSKSYSNVSEVKSKFADYSLTTPRVNERWIENARGANSSTYLDVENAALKRLNDSLGDKELVTALTNLHKDILYKNINTLVKKYPEINFEVYSDFKSLRFAFTPKEIPKDIKEKFLKDLDKTYSEANYEFAKKIKSLDGIGSENPSLWFEAGIASSADGAGQAAKRARKLSRDGPKIVSFDTIRKEMDADVLSIKKYSDELKSTPLYKAGLTEAVENSESRILSLSAVETVRKSIGKYSKDEVETLAKKSNGDSAALVANALDINEVQSEFLTKYGVKLTSSESQDLVDYVNRLDGLTPGLWQKMRVTASLDSATKGGFSGDVTGMGARNIQQVAKDLLKTNSTKAEDILVATRKGEQEITETFNQIKDKFNDVVESTLKKRNVSYSSKCSGDDCVVIPTEQLKKSDELAIVNSFRQQSNPSQYRLSFIPPGIEESKRTLLATHGELIEKQIRKEIVGVSVGKIRPEKLAKITLGTKMPSQVNKGKVELYLGVGKDIELSKAERDLIIKAYSRAVKKTNSSLSKENLGNEAIDYSSGVVEFIN